MGRNVRSALLTLVLLLGLVPLAPAAGAHEPVSLVAFVCGDLGTETVRVSPDGTLHIRGQTLTGESQSDDPRFDGYFRRTTNVTIAPDGSGVAWGVHEQRSHSFEGAWNIRFNVPFDTSGFLGVGRGSGVRDFAGYRVSGDISPDDGTTPNPCNPVLESSRFDGVVFTPH